METIRKYHEIVRNSTPIKQNNLQDIGKWTRKRWKEWKEHINRMSNTNLDEQKKIIQQGEDLSIDHPQDGVNIINIRRVDIHFHYKQAVGLSKEKKKKKYCPNYFKILIAHILVLPKNSLYVWVI